MTECSRSTEINSYPFDRESNSLFEFDRKLETLYEGRALFPKRQPQGCLPYPVVELAEAPPVQPSLQRVLAEAGCAGGVDVLHANPRVHVIEGRVIGAGQNDLI